MNKLRKYQPNSIKKKKVVIQIVCYNCKSWKNMLYKCANNIDYVCSNCLQLVGHEGPEIGNQSKITYDKTK